jgi:hypothetical protein
MVGAGFVDSLARPNGNITGVSILANELDGKRQEIVIEAVPGLRRMAALADFNRAPVKLEALQEAARARNIELSIVRVAKGEDIAAAVDEAHASGAGALNVLASPILFGSRRLIFDRAASLGLPAIYQTPEACSHDAVPQPSASDQCVPFVSIKRQEGGQGAAEEGRQRGKCLPVGVVDDEARFSLFGGRWWREAAGSFGHEAIPGTRSRLLLTLRHPGLAQDF